MIRHRIPPETGEHAEWLSIGVQLLPRDAAAATAAGAAVVVAACKITLLILAGWPFLLVMAALSLQPL